MGNAFQPATVEEQQRHGGVDRLLKGDLNNQTINGWSVREVRLAPGERSYVEVGSKVAIAAKNEAASAREPARISVDLLRSGQPPENLYKADEGPRKVSKSEYEGFFANQIQMTHH